jgi:hypothetical protein
VYSVLWRQCAIKLTGFVKVKWRNANPQKWTIFIKISSRFYRLSCKLIGYEEVVSMHFDLYIIILDKPGVGSRNRHFIFDFLLNSGMTGSGWWKLVEAYFDLGLLLVFALLIP